MQLRPLQIVPDVRERTAGLSLGAAARDISVLQGVFNVVLFVPSGSLSGKAAPYRLVDARTLTQTPAGTSPAH